MEKLFARVLRKNQTEAEKKLWYHLRNRQVLNCKFRRQHDIGHYVTDFCCIDKKIIIELDGGQHKNQKQYDDKRSFYFESKGYSILRFWNDEVLSNIEGVLETILESINRPSPSLSLEGRGKS